MSNKYMRSLDWRYDFVTPDWKNPNEEEQSSLSKKEELKSCIYCGSTEDIRSIELEKGYGKEDICISCIRDNLKWFIENDEIEKYNFLKQQIE